jgi:cytochrome c
VAFLPDGRLATGGHDGRIGIWRAGDPEPELVVAAHDAPVAALAAVPDGRLASAGWDGTAQVGLPGGEARVLVGHTGPVNAVAFLPDGGLVTAGYDQTLRYWRPDGPAGLVVTLATQLNALAVAPDGEVWVAGADGMLRGFDAGGAALAEVEIGAAPLVALALSPDGGRLAAGGVDGRITVVARAERGVEAVAETGDAPVWALAFTADGDQVLAGGADNVVRAWDSGTGEALSSPPTVGSRDALGDSRGAQVFRACAACHTLTPEDGNRAGPTLHGLFGRRIATAAGYDYSSALRDLDIVWTPETVSELFDVGPMTYTPGTKMPEQRITSADDRAALIAFLQERTR